MKPTLLLTSRATAVLYALALCTVLASCALLDNKPPPELHTFTLDGAGPAIAADQSVAAVGPVLLLEVPHAATGYDSTRMVYVRQSQTHDAYALSVWADTPARLLAPLMLAHLKQTGMFRAVLLAPTSGRTDLRLDTTLLRLEQNFLQVPSVVHFTVQVTLMDSSTKQVLASRTIDVVQAARSEDAAGGAGAAQSAVQQGLHQVAAFVQSVLAR